MQLDAEKVRSVAQESCVTPQQEEKRAVTVGIALLAFALYFGLRRFDIPILLYFGLEILF